MPEEIKRGPLWIVGRIFLIAAIAGIIGAFIFVQRTIPDQSPIAITAIRDWQSTQRLPAKQVLERYKFIVREKSILAIPVDPRQKSFYAQTDGPIHYTPGTQAANADSPILKY